MDVLVAGSGGREHALAWALSRSPSVNRVICAPGNPGMEEIASCRPVAAGDIEGVAALAESEGVDLVVVGPEAPLVAGLADVLRSRGKAVLGPGAAGARIEASKSWAKELMAACGVPCAASQTFDGASEARAFVRSRGLPIVVKADGLAAGKGVAVCRSVAEADEAISLCLEQAAFGEAGRRVVIEEELSGEELSVIALVSGTQVLAFQPAQDFKRARDGDAGPNTGGMGSFSPVPSCTPEIFDQVTRTILEPVASALAVQEGGYRGFLYAGIMLTAEGPKVLEFNCRMGDPEAQALLPRLDCDVAEAFLACARGELSGSKLAWSGEVCVTVVAASAGYPGPSPSGFAIRGIAEASRVSGLPVFQAGTARNEAGEVVTAGGRVLAVGALGASAEQARGLAYQGLEEISFEGMWYRGDIAAGRRGQAG